MTAIRPASAERFLAAPPKDVFLFLLHGENSGLVSLRAQALARLTTGRDADPLQILRMDGDAIVGEPGRLADEAYAISMFREKRALRIVNGRKALAGALEPLLKAPPEDFAVIIEAGVLKKDAPLRLLVENASAGAAIDCAPDSVADLAALVEAQAKAAGVSLDVQARDLLVSLLPPDRLSSVAEISRLMLYAASTKTLNEQDIRRVVDNGAQLAVQDLVDAAFLGEIATTDTLLLQLATQGLEPNAILAALIFHATLLHRACVLMENNRSREDATSDAQRHGLFFKRRATFERQLQRLNARSVLGLLDSLDTALGNIRKFPKIGDAIAMRMLWQANRSGTGRPGGGGTLMRKQPAGSLAR